MKESVQFFGEREGMKNRCRSIYFINQIFFPDSFLVVIEVLFFSQYFNLSFLQFSTLTSISILVSMFLEIPSGIISDRFGRKKLLIIGNCLDILGVFFLIFYGRFVKAEFSVVLLIEIIRTIGRALASGNFEIIIFKMYENLEIKEKHLKRDSTNFFLIGILLSSIFGYMSTHLYSYLLLLPIMIDTCIKMIKLVLYFFLDDLFTYDNHVINKKSNFFSVREIIKKNLCGNNIQILKVILIFSMIFVISRMSFSLYQPLFEELGFSMKMYGIMIFLLNFSLFLVTFLKKEFLNRLSENVSIKVIVLILLSQGLVYFIKEIPVKSIKYLIIFITLFGMQGIRIIAEGLSNYYINENLKNTENKSFFFSTYHTMILILYSLFFQLIGVLEYRSNSFVLTYVISCIVFATFIYAVFLLKLKKQEDI